MHARSWEATRPVPELGDRLVTTSGSFPLENRHCTPFLCQHVLSFQPPPPDVAVVRVGR